MAEDPHLERAVRKAVSYIEAELNAVRTDPYAVNIITYALILADSSQADNAINMLSALAISEGMSIDISQSVTLEQTFTYLFTAATMIVLLTTT